MGGKKVGKCRSGDILASLGTDDKADLKLEARPKRCLTDIRVGPQKYPPS